jgi:hypothetical protein
MLPEVLNSLDPVLNSRAHAQSDAPDIPGIANDVPLERVVIIEHWVIGSAKEIGGRT